MTTPPPGVVEPVEPVDDDDEVEQFDEFWRAHIASRTPARCRIRGVLVTAPADLPVAVELRMDAAATDAEVKYLLGLLIGPDVFDQLVDKGVGEAELQMLLVWAETNASGVRKTLPEIAEAMAQVDKAKADEAAGEGKAPNRATRRRRKRRKR